MNEFHIYHKQLTFEPRGIRPPILKYVKTAATLSMKQESKMASLSYSHRIPLAPSSLKKWSMTLMHSVMNICRLT